MPEPGNKGTQATKPCDPLRFVSDCAPESSAFFWPPHSRMLLLPSPVATTRSSWAAENAQPVNSFLRCCHTVRELSLVLQNKNVQIRGEGSRIQQRVLGSYGESHVCRAQHADV